jgi:hypothetical protein
MTVRAAVALWILAFLGLTATTIARSRRIAAVSTNALTIPPLRSVALALSSVQLDSAVVDFVDGDPFRLTNQPSRVRYNALPTETAADAPAIARDPRPTMTLRAVAGGPPWQALIEGIPGRGQPTLVRPGSVIEKVIIRLITRDSVVVRTGDTTFVLSFPRRS